jgi:Outer membrane protein beta-barrel domain
MRHLPSGIAGVALAILVGVGPVQAQGVRFGAGAGPTFSLEEGGGTDFHVLGTLAFGGSADRPLGFRADGMWDFADGGNLIIGTGNVVYNFSVSDETKFRPYLIGGAGVYYFSPDNDAFDSSTDFGINAGAGFTAPIGSGTTKIFGEVRFHNIFTDGESTNIMPLTLGLMFGR